MKLARRRGAELMDRPDADPRELARSLEDLRRVGCLGGRRTAVRLVMEIAARAASRPVTVLDVGTGGADVPIALVAAARRARLPLRVTATDLHDTTLAYARRRVAGHPEITVERADLLDLPYADGSFDIVMCNTTLHHFSDADAGRALAGMSRVAGAGVVVTDLVRSRAALAGAVLLAHTVWRSHPITRHDGPVSVRAAFTPAELRGLASEVVEDGVRVRRHPLFRLSLVIDRLAGTPAEGAE